MLKIKRGDTLISKVNMDGLTYGKEYTITGVSISDWGNSRIGDISITDDNGRNWEFGQLGDEESWDKFFVDQLQWNRLSKIDDIINE